MMFIEVMTLSPENRVLEIPVTSICQVNARRRTVIFKSSKGDLIELEMTPEGFFQYLRLRSVNAKFVDVYSASGVHSIVAVDSIVSLTRSKQPDLWLAEYRTASGNACSGYVSEEAVCLGPLATSAALAGEDDRPPELCDDDDVVDNAVNQAFADDDEDAEAV